MNRTKLRSSTAIDTVLELAVGAAASKSNAPSGLGEQAQADKPTESAGLGVALTPNAVSKYLQDMAANSCGEIDALISDLSALREKLAADTGRIEQDVVAFATLNQSVIKLTEVVVDSVAHVKPSSLGQ